MKNAKNAVGYWAAGLAAVAGLAAGARADEPVAEIISAHAVTTSTVDATGGAVHNADNFLFEATTLPYFDSVTKYVEVPDYLGSTASSALALGFNAGRELSNENGIIHWLFSSDSIGQVRARRAEIVAGSPVDTSAATTGERGLDITFRVNIRARLTLATWVMLSRVNAATGASAGSSGANLSFDHGATPLFADTTSIAVGGATQMHTRGGQNVILNRGEYRLHGATNCNVSASGTTAQGATLDLESQFVAELVFDPIGCPADFNGDGFVDFFDFNDFIDCFEGVACPPGKDADFNGDGFPDFLDYQDFIEALEIGCGE